LGAKLEATIANVAWHFPIPLGNFIKAILFAFFILEALCLHVFEGLVPIFVALVDLLARPSLFCSLIAITALVVHLSACARSSLGNALKILTVVAQSILLSASIHNLLSKEAFVVAVTTIIRGPQFKVRILLTSLVDTLALSGVQS
jgi:hypothetical protein